MGKITSIYLTDEEHKELEKFCEENQCTQYSALKTALKELLYKPIEKTEETIVSKEQNMKKSEAIEVIEKDEENSDESMLKQLVEALRQNE